MRIIIYGAGAIGSVIGGYLFQHHHDVVLIGREGHVRSINNQGLKMTTPSGTLTLKIPAFTSIHELVFHSDDVVFLCVKAQDTLAAITDLRKYVQEVPVFLLQNGVRNEEITHRYFPQTYGVKLRLGAEYITDGEVVCRRDPPGWLIIGRFPNGSDQVCENVANVLRASDIPVKVTQDIMPYKWGKLVSNLGNAVTAITGIKDSISESIVRATREEFVSLANQAKVSWIDEDDAVKDWPEAEQAVRSRIIQKQKTGGFTSTWQSLTRQQGTVETDFLNGEVVRLAQKLGMVAPINEKLVQITQEMALNREKPGKYSSEQLRSLLGMK